MEPSDLRRRLRGALEQANRRAADRRAVADEASHLWAQRLTEAVVPAFHAMQNVLNGEGHRFSVSTPGEAARLSPQRSAGEFIEMVLDSDRELPAVLVRSTRGRGSRTISSERIVAEGPGIAELGEEAVVGVLIEEIVPFIAR